MINAWTATELTGLLGVISKSHSTDSFWCSTACVKGNLARKWSFSIKHQLAVKSFHAKDYLLLRLSQWKWIIKIILTCHFLKTGPTLQVGKQVVILNMRTGTLTLISHLSRIAFCYFQKLYKYQERKRKPFKKSFAQSMKPKVNFALAVWNLPLFQVQFTLPHLEGVP